MCQYLLQDILNLHSSLRWPVLLFLSFFALLFGFGILQNKLGNIIPILFPRNVYVRLETFLP